MTTPRRQRMRELGPPQSGHQVDVIERADALGHWFAFSYMVRTPVGDWLEFETLTVAEQHIQSSRAARPPADEQRDFAEQLDSMFPRP